MVVYLIRCGFAGFEGFSGSDERRERKSDFENSEDERRTRIGSLKKKAINSVEKETEGSSEFSARTSVNSSVLRACDVAILDPVSYDEHTIQTIDRRLELEVRSCISC